MNKSGLTIVCDESGMAGLVDSAGRMVVPCQYGKILDYDDDGYIRVLKGDIYGTLDLEGHAVIPHTVGLTHLGVFYEGTARAQKNGMWGLVDEYGEEVTEFCYREIKAHRRWGYSAVRDDDVCGTLAEDGHFVASVRKSKYQSVRVFHNDVAPALTWDNRWVFVDRDLKRMNGYEYYGMDPVLRHGIYNIVWERESYGAARYDGNPIVDDKFDFPLHFENGLAIAGKKCLDAAGNQIVMDDGQPQYAMGQSMLICKRNPDFLSGLLCF